MGTNKIVQGCYADFKLIKTRGVIQMVIEIPVGPAADAFMDTFGLPNPNEEMWVAVAALNKTAVVKNEDAINAIRLAGMLCNNHRFGQWLVDERGFSEINPKNAESVAVALREIVGVSSRKDFDTNSEAIIAFNRLKSEFDEFVMGV